MISGEDLPLETESCSIPSEFPERFFFPALFPFELRPRFDPSQTIHAMYRNK